MSRKVVRSDTQEYLDVMGQAAEGKYVEVFRRHLPGGVLEMTYESTHTKPSAGVPNPEVLVRVSSEARFLTKAHTNYSDWRRAWWREALQNALGVGVGTTEVALDCTYTRNAEGHILSVTVSCADNGKGMTREVLQSAFLALGGSTKGVTDRGGFGVAKLLLLMPWLSWEVRSNQWYASGRGIEGMDTIREGPFIQGTKITAVMPQSEYTTDSHARSVLNMSHLPGVSFRVNGEPHTASLQHGKLLKDFGFGKLYHSKTPKNSQILIRDRGLFTFFGGDYASELGCLILELTGDPKELLTENRDSLAKQEHRSALQKEVVRLSREKEQALEAAKGFFAQPYLGTGRFNHAKGATDVLKAIGPIPARPEGTPAPIKALSEEQLDQIVAAIEAVVSKAPGDFSSARRVDAGSVRAAIKLAPPTDATGALVLAQALTWSPDFFIRQAIDGYKVPEKFYPATMSPEVRALASCWTEAIRMVFIQKKCFKEFGVGWIFHESRAAEHFTEPGTGREWLLINPLSGLSKGTKILRHKTDEELWRVLASAVHEATHMIDVMPDHDLAFAAQITHNFALCGPSFDLLEKANAAILGAAAPKPSAPRRHLVKVPFTFSPAAHRLKINLGQAPSQVPELAAQLREQHYPGEAFQVLEAAAADWPQQILDLAPSHGYYNAARQANAALIKRLLSGVPPRDRELAQRAFGWESAPSLKLDLELAAQLLGLLNGLFLGDIMVRLRTDETYAMLHTVGCDRAYDDRLEKENPADTFSAAVAWCLRLMGSSTEQSDDPTRVRLGYEDPLGKLLIEAAGGPFPVGVQIVKLPARFVASAFDVNYLAPDGVEIPGFFPPSKLQDTVYRRTW